MMKWRSSAFASLGATQKIDIQYPAGALQDRCLPVFHSNSDYLESIPCRHCLSARRGIANLIAFIPDLVTEDDACRLPDLNGEDFPITNMTPSRRRCTSCRTILKSEARSNGRVRAAFKNVSDVIHLPLNYSIGMIPISDSRFCNSFPLHAILFVIAP